MEDPLDLVLRYHRQTKHHFGRFARSLGFLDWKNQPDPFRRFEGAALVHLPILGPDEEPRSPPYEDLYGPAVVPAVAVSLRSLSRLFEFALALSAWKQVGDTRWALRSNPSSGNLHPTEGYLLVGPDVDPALAAGLYHYAPKEHALELRREFPEELFSGLTAGLPSDAFLVGLSSIHWREAWKYGERAFRYCQHDVGHAIATIRIAAATLGWSAMVLEGMASPTIESLLALDRPGPDDEFQEAEREEPDLMMALWPPPSEQDGAGPIRFLPLHLDPVVVGELAELKPCGAANRLSTDDPVPWEIIDQVTTASRRPDDEPRTLELVNEPDRADAVEIGRSAGPSAGEIIRQRRSLQACDGKTSITAETFFRILSRLMPRTDRGVSLRPVPWDGIPWDPSIHLVLFVHRVVDLVPGLYVLPRDSRRTDALRGAMRPEFAWTTPAGCPPDLPFYRVAEGDVRGLATRVSCGQDIAGDGAFSLGMIAEFEPVLRTTGPWFYRQLFWEAGAIGQVLYLEAEAAGVRGTGIGCFFDDPVHDVFGLRDTTFQSLYHFTVGGPVEDSRLTTLPPYGEPA